MLRETMQTHLHTASLRSYLKYRELLSSFRSHPPTTNHTSSFVSMIASLFLVIRLCLLPLFVRYFLVFHYFNNFFFNFFHNTSLSTTFYFSFCCSSFFYIKFSLFCSYMYFIHFLYYIFSSIFQQHSLQKQELRLVERRRLSYDRYTYR